MIFSRPLLAFSAAVLSSLLLLVGVLVYGRCVEPRWVEETHWPLHAPHWQGAPLRLAVLADFHARSGDGEYLDTLVRQTLAAKPDVVLLLGDYVNEPRLGDSMDVATLGRHLSPLSQLPCYAVLGNHDVDYGVKAVRSMLEGFGARVIEGEVQALEVGGDTLYLAGMRCLCSFDTPGHKLVLPQDKPVTCLMLSHSPVGGYFAPKGVTATLAGHTHGGQVCLPGGIPLVRPDRRVRWDEMVGELSLKGKPVYVSRGLGTSMVPVRLFCRPELLLVELSGKERG